MESSTLETKKNEREVSFMVLEKWGREIPSDNIQFSFELYLQRTNLGRSKILSIKLPFLI